VDLFTGEHMKPPYTDMNPNALVPMIEDGDLRLTESSAILKYLADKFELPVYPKDIKLRAKVNEAMDWFNTNLYRDFAYGVVYPQLFPHHKRPSDEIQSGTINWGKNLSKKWLTVLNDNMIGPKKNYLVGNEMTIADYFGAGLLTSGEVIGCDFSAVNEEGVGQTELLEMAAQRLSFRFLHAQSLDDQDAAILGLGRKRVPERERAHFLRQADGMAAGVRAE